MTDGEAIYAWSEDLGAIEYAPIYGGEFSTFPVPAPAMGGARQVGDKVLVDDEAVYVAQSLGAFAQIVRIDKSTGETQALVDRDDTWETPAVLTITEQELIYYYSSFDGFTSIESVPLQGGTPYTIARFPDEQWRGVKNALVVGDDLLAVVYVDGISGPTAVWIEQYQLEERIVGEPFFDHVNDVYRTNDALVLFRGGVEFQRCAFSE